MAKTRDDSERNRKMIDDLIESHRRLNEMLDEELQSSKGMLTNDQLRGIELDKISNNQRLINELKAKANLLSTDDEKLLREVIAEQRKLNAEIEKEKKSRESVNNVLRLYQNWLKQGWQYLMQSDKVIKSTILNLGLSGAKADEMRLSFEQSAGFVAQLGGSLEDVQKIMEGYADETGEARTLSAKMVGDIEAIGKGTGLGVEQATKLAAQFRFMGVDAEKTMNLVQGVVDTSERMGVNTTKVLKNIADNYKKLNTFNFQKGSKGMAEMAISAEKTRVSIESALNVAEIGRSLDKVIDLSANLQVMGGEFAKMDWATFWYTARNEPDKLNDQISKLTRGVVTLRKNSDGTFEKFISPADRDRLNAVAKDLGMTTEELTVIAQKRFDLDKLDNVLQAKGLTGREKELIAGAAMFDSKTAKYQVELAGHMRDVTSLTKEEAQSFAKQQVLLKDRAKDAMTFEEVFKATMNELKSALLPLLRTVNSVLAGIRPIVEPIVKFLTEGKAGWLKVAAAFMIAGGLWKGILQPLAQRVGGATVGKLANAIGGGAAKTAGEGSALKGAAGAGGGLLKGGAGIGIAAAGIGAAGLGIGEGVNLAAQGISKLADAMSKLDDKKVQALQGIVRSLTVMIGIGAAAAAAIVIFGGASQAVAPGLILFGAAMIGIGFGINLAAKGIGKMAEGFATMFTAAKGVGPAFSQISDGVWDIGKAMIANSEGMSDFASTLKTIGKNAENVTKVGEAFKNMGAVLSGNKDDFLAIQNAVSSIASTKIKEGSFISELSNLFNKPLLVEFKDKEVAITTDVTFNVNGTKFHQAVDTVGVVTQGSVAQKIGKEGKSGTK